jgi:hypothetical protein
MERCRGLSPHVSVILEQIIRNPFMTQQLSWSAKGVLSLLMATLFFALFFGLASAADIVSSSTFIDSDGDGQVDHAKITFDENIDQCTYEAADWSIDTAGTINVSAITGINTSDPESTGDGACDGTDAVVYVSLTADADVTGGATAPQITYTNGTTTGSLSGVTTAEISTKSTMSLSDAAAPTVASENIADGASNISRNGTVVLTFSEPMDATAAEGTEFAFSPDLGTYTTAWTVGNTILTLSYPTLYACMTTVTFTTDNAELDASAGSVTTLITTGSEDGDITFRTRSCSTDASAPVQETSYDISASVPSGEYEAGDRMNLTWSSNSVSFADIYYSLDGGDTYMTVAMGVNGGMYRWTLPDVSGTVTMKFVGTDLVDELVEDVVLEAFTIGDAATEEETVEETEDVDVSDYAYSYIRGTAFSTVYYIDGNDMRHPILDQQTYFTWEDSFSSVVMVDDSLLSEFDMGAPLLPKPSVVLVKIQSDNSVYAVVENPDDMFSPLLRKIESESVANRIYGASWADFVVDIPPTAWPRYSQGEIIDDEFDISPGSVMKTRSKIAKLLAA